MIDLPRQAIVTQLQLNIAGGALFAAHISPVRLVAHRSPPFHGGNTSSTLVRVTRMVKIRLPLFLWLGIQLKTAFYIYSRVEQFGSLLGS